MGRRQPPGWRQVSASELAQFEISNLKGHAAERYEAVRTLYAAMSALRAADALPPGVVTTKGAEFQKARGSLSAGTQAAHVLPRQLLINGKSLDHWLSGSALPDLDFLGSQPG
jgi:hypothetical protein